MLTCDNGHPIVKCKEKLRSWQGRVHAKECSLCKAEIDRDQRRWRCEERCDFNVCTRCYDSWQRRTMTTPGPMSPKSIASSHAPVKSALKSGSRVRSAKLAPEVGAEVQVFSGSQKKWLRARVVGVQTGEVTVAYEAPNGAQTLKRLALESHELQLEPAPPAGGCGTSAEYTLTEDTSKAEGKWRPSIPSCFSCLDVLTQIITRGNRGAAFLAAKAQERGVVSLPSGLMYKVVQHGRGKRHPRLDSWCSVHYRGSLINGKEFDTTYDGSAPAVLQPKQVIAGWEEAMQLMVEGDIWDLYIPPELGYKDAVGPIPANSVLVFTVELVKLRD